MTRSEHLAWCKQRALEYVEQGDLTNGIRSMLSDLSKHPDTEKHPFIMMGVMLQIGGHLDTKASVIDFIDGFN